MMDAVAPFDLLLTLIGDPETQRITSERAVIESWLRVEAALATAQGELGVIDRADAEAIVAACTIDQVDAAALWDAARTVGYPILPLVRQIAGTLPSPANGRVHYGATTQDVMDTGLALVMVSVTERLTELLDGFGDTLARRVDEHRATPMAARTHGQQAVPTTFGTKLAVFLAQATEVSHTIQRARLRIGRVSLWGAGGTAAALGSTASATRRRVAELLGLDDAPIPWHVDRSGVLELAHACTAVNVLCTRFAREVIDLSRTEIGEVSERGGGHYGASSTMPQKVNPIASEGVVGAAVTAESLAAAIARAGEAGHERAAGEWQIEWTVLPQLVNLTAAALRTTADVAGSLVVHPEQMRRNLEADHGLIMAEAYMIHLAERHGREAAHDLVHDAVQQVRRDGGALPDAIGVAERIAADDYLGLAEQVCVDAIAAWQARGDQY